MYKLFRSAAAVEHTLRCLFGCLGRVLRLGSQQCSAERFLGQLRDMAVEKTQYTKAANHSEIGVPAETLRKHGHAPRRTTSVVKVSLSL